MEADDLRNARRVALQVLPSALLAPELFDLFVRQVRAVAQVEHPNVVRLRSIGREAGIAYLISDLCVGESLPRYLARRGGRMRIQELLAWSEQLACALAHLHDRGIFHGDLNPDALVIDAAGHLTLTTFAVPWRRADAIVIGRPGYMAPEQIAGEPPSSATDQYAFAVMCFEALTGAHPFAGTTADELLHAHVRQPRPLASSVSASVSASVAAVIQRAMAISPGARFTNLTALHSALVAAARQGSMPMEKVNTPGEVRAVDGKVLVRVGGWVSAVTADAVEGSEDTVIRASAGAVEPPEIAPEDATQNIVVERAIEPTNVTERPADPESETVLLDLDEFRSELNADIQT